MPRLGSGFGFPRTAAGTRSSLCNAHRMGAMKGSIPPETNASASASAAGPASGEEDRNPEGQHPEGTVRDPLPAGGIAPGESNYALLLSYDGAGFCGWQIQQNGESVQGRLEAALTTILRVPARLTGSGRTDAGVHALYQVANAFLPAGLDTKRLRANLNGLAGPEISVRTIVPVASDFHARFRAKGKHYQYRIFNRPYPTVFASRHSWWVKRPLDLEAMRRAALYLSGRHDFSAFRSSHCKAKHPLREIRRLDIELSESSEGMLLIDLEADSFLQHMARIIVGTLAAVGLGVLAPDALPGMLASKNRENAAVTAPAAGLHLMKVCYDLEEFPELLAFGRF